MGTLKFIFLYMPEKYPYQNFSLTDMKGEEWEDIPSFDGVFQISNYGRVKAVSRWVEVTGRQGYWLKEKIRKTRVFTRVLSDGKRKQHYLGFWFRFERKKYAIGIARMVYYLFVRKFNLEDRRLAVSYRDEDTLNIRPDNLFLTTRSEYVAKSYRLNRRPRNAYDTEARAVSQYDLQGKWIKTYASMTLAAKATGITSTMISTALRTPNKYSGNYLWQYKEHKEGLKRIPSYAKEKLASDELHATVVSQYDLSGGKMREYPNLKAAARAMKCQPGMIRRVLMGDLLTARGYYWRLGQGPPQVAMDHLEESRRNWEKKICRPVTQYGLDGQRIGSYPSQAEAGRQLDLNQMEIYRAVRNGRLHTGKNYFWRYGEGPAVIEVPERMTRQHYLQEFYQQPVTQYDLQGKRVAFFGSIKEASRRVKVQPVVLWQALTGKLHTTAGCYWRLGKGKAKINMHELESAKQLRLQKQSRRIIQYDMSGNKINEYPSLVEAEKATGAAPANIRKAATGKIKSAKGYLWKYAG
jgi:hypothetical protein